MYSASLLPTTLLSLIFASPALATWTPHDPFRDVAALAPKPPEEPVCRLKPVTPLEPVDDDLFLSFEDWKSKRSSESQQQPGSVNLPNASASTPVAVAGGDTAVDALPGATSETTSSVSIEDVVSDGLHATTTPASEPLSPHFRIPLTDRFNYASLDCSARVHTAHRGAKSAANILSSKRDRYLLSPCASAPQFVVVELCEDIWIDTVQLANYEFFSGVFREFTVSVAKTYATDSAGWTVVGTYTAKNVRGVQSFHPPNSLRDFYRFIRIDFLSHYGAEYYCPISLLRVYGLTHLEQWKWDIWEKESRAKLLEQEARLQGQEHTVPAVELAEPPQPVQTPVLVDQDLTSSPVGSSAVETAPAAVSTNATTADNSNAAEETVVFRHSTDIAPPFTPLEPATPSSSEPTPELQTASGAIRSNSTSSSVPHAASAPESSSSSVPTVVAMTPTISLSPPGPPAYLPSTGESIYRTIMNRLTALEANTTLYARYVEEQTAGVREMLRRLGEDVGRLEGIGRAQAQLYQRSVHDFERQRRRMEVEQRELITKVNDLADEIVLEKRLGIAQLCLLLAVLVFLSLTRGSRGDVASEHAFLLPSVPRHLSMKEWGRRKLSLSSDWVSRLRTRSRSLTPGPPEPPQAGAIVFPSVPSTPSAKSLQKRPPLPPLEHVASSPRSRPRTPSRRHPHFVHGRAGGAGPATPPTSARPILQRSNSHSSAAAAVVGSVEMLVGPVPRSAKRWARTAHLHEVRPRERERERENGPVDGTRTPARSVGADALRRLNIVDGTSALRVDEGPPPGSGNGSADAWVDTDAEGSEVDWVGHPGGGAAVDVFG